MKMFVFKFRMDHCIVIAEDEGQAREMAKKDGYDIDQMDCESYDLSPGVKVYAEE